MQPQISTFISSQFYSGKVENAEILPSLIGSPPFYEYPLFQPVVFLHVSSEEIIHKKSYRNNGEAQVICSLLQMLNHTFPGIPLSSYGVISPYSGQVSLIKKSLNSLSSLGTENGKQIEVNSVDGFQGREKDVIIYSTVRSFQMSQGKKKNQKASIGFLRDARRMNVSLSRARLCLLVVGNAKVLRIDKKWRKLVEYSHEMKTLYQVGAKRGENDLAEINKNCEKHRMEWKIRTEAPKTIEIEKEKEEKEE